MARVTGLDAGDGAAVVTRMAAQLDHAGRGAVLAGSTGSADATGAVGVARADPTVTAALSTVDNVETGAGQISTVLALREQVDGRAGRYGTAASAADGAPPAPERGVARRTRARASPAAVLTRTTRAAPGRRGTDRGGWMYPEAPCSLAPRVICS